MGRHGSRKSNQEPRRLRVYEQWQGNERFFCWGHCVTGPSWKSGMGSLALLTAPTVVFLVLVVPYMARAINPVIWVVSIILPVFCGSMLLLTSCSDPGILPRQEPDEEWLQARKPRTKDVNVNGHRVTVRYNDTCHFYQPPRAHHCSVNDNCIQRFDHHCPWVGTTIGKRNYRTFLLFIYSTSVYIAWTFGVCLGSLFVKHAELEAAAAAGPQPAASSNSDSLSSNLWLQTIGQSGAAIALMIFTFIFFWFVVGLSGFHTWLVATNQTTYENFRYNHNQVPNPYNEGLLSNCASVWCHRVPPSKVQFRAYLDEVVREPVELGYPDWCPPQPIAAPPPREVQLSPMGGAPPGMAVASSQAPATAGSGGGQWSNTAAGVQYGSATDTQQQQQYSSAANGSYGRYTPQQQQQQQGLGLRTPSGSQGPPAAAGATGSQMSFCSNQDRASELPISRHTGQPYSSVSPPLLGPSYQAAGAAAAGVQQGPLGAGAVASAPLPQLDDSSMSGSGYNTPQQQHQKGAQQQGATGPLTAALQQQQQQPLHVLQQQGMGQQQHQQQQQWGQGHAQVQKPRRAASIELPDANGHGGAQLPQQLQQMQQHQQQQQGYQAGAVMSPHAGQGPAVSTQQVELDMSGLQPHSSSCLI